MATINMDHKQFEKSLKEEKLVLVDFWAPWCGYCRRIGPAYDKIAEEYANTFLAGKVNIDENLRLAEGGDLLRVQLFGRIQGQPVPWEQPLGQHG